MNKPTRVFLFFLCSFLLAFTVGATVPTITGELSRTEEFITPNETEDSGVFFTTVTLAGKYGSKIAYITEADLTDPHLTVKVINCGKYTVSFSTVAKAVTSYSAVHETVLSAVNGDMWFNKVHSNTNVTKKVLSTTRGVLMINREIWATEQIGMENYVATNAEQGTYSPDKTAFGITSRNQPLVGSPVITVSGTNTTKGLSFTPDGINRLPAWNSLIVYNYRINSSNYALDDAYEVVITADSTAFFVGGITSGIVTAIYPPDSETRPAIGEHDIVLTARGDKIPILRDSFALGDAVSFSCTISDRYGNDRLWQDAVDVIGGHMTVLSEDRAANVFTGGEYPTTLIGFKDDGTFMTCVMSSTKTKTYTGLKQTQAVEFCRELGYNSVFYLDGGGSSTSVTLLDGTYTTRNNCSDGSPRSVNNAVAVVYSPTPVTEHTGSYAYMKQVLDLSTVSPLHLDGLALSEIMIKPHHATAEYDSDECALRLTVTQSTVDAYASVDYTKMKTVKANETPYVLFRLRTDVSSVTAFRLYYNTSLGGNYSETNSALVTLLSSGDGWVWGLADMSSAANWTGNLLSLRLDFLEGITASTGSHVWVDSVCLCHSLSEVENCKSGIYPADAVESFSGLVISFAEEHSPKLTALTGDFTLVDGEMKLWELEEEYPHDSFTVVDRNGRLLGENEWITTSSTLIRYDGGSNRILSKNTVILKGDVDKNGEISSVDALLALRYSVGLTALDDEAVRAASLSGDGKVSSADALHILRYSVGLDDLLR